MLYKKYLCSCKFEVYRECKLLQNKIVNLMNDSIDRYTRIFNKLNDSHVSPKAYWSIFKMLLNNKKLYYSTSVL